MDSVFVCLDFSLLMILVYPASMLMRDVLIVAMMMVLEELCLSIVPYLLALNAIKLQIILLMALNVFLVI